jgi:hypothetical protein
VIKIAESKILLFVPMTFLIILNFFSAVFIATTGSADIFDPISIDVIINGSTTEIDYSTIDTTFRLDALIGALTWIITCTVLAGILGIQIVGSGLASFSVKAIVIGTIWISSYIFFGLTAFPFIQSIPSFFGETIFLVMTIVFAYGVFKEIGGSE